MNEEVFRPVPIDNAQPRSLTEDEQQHIEFIIVRRTGIPSPRYISQLTGAERDALLSDEIVDERNSRFDSLATHSEEELARLYAHEKHELEREVELYLKPADTDTLDRWLQKDGWTPAEALTLWLGNEPRHSVNLGSWAEDNRRLTGAVVEVAERWDLIRRALWVGTLDEPLSPADFIRWAAKTKRSLPELLADVVITETPVSNHPALEAEAAQLRKEVERLTEKLVDIDKPNYKMAVKLFAALCVQIYGYDPKKRNKATVVITEVLAKHWEGRCDKSVRSYIQEAVKELPQGEKKLASLNFDEAPTEGKSEPSE